MSRKQIAIAALILGASGTANAFDIGHLTCQNVGQLAAQMAIDALTPGPSKAEPDHWFKMAQGLLGLATKEEEYKPDHTYIAQPFSPSGAQYTGSYWLNPWMVKQPQTDD